jgi:DNA-binding transcriptional LysR family regulator
VRRQNHANAERKFCLANELCIRAAVFALNGLSIPVAGVYRLEGRAASANANSTTKDHPMLLFPALPPGVRRTCSIADLEIVACYLAAIRNDKQIYTWQMALDALRDMGLFIRRTKLIEIVNRAKRWGVPELRQSLIEVNRAGKTACLSAYGDALLDTLSPAVQPYYRFVNNPAAHLSTPRLQIRILTENVFARRFFPSTVATFMDEYDRKDAAHPPLSIAVEETPKLNVALDRLRDDLTVLFLLHLERPGKEYHNLPTRDHIDAIPTGVVLDDVVVFRKADEKGQQQEPKWHAAIKAATPLTLASLKETPLAVVDYADFEQTLDEIGHSATRVRLGSIGALLECVNTGRFAGICTSWVPIFGANYRARGLEVRRIKIHLEQLRLSMYTRKERGMHGIEKSFYDFVMNQFKHKTKHVMEFRDNDWPKPLASVP